MARTYRLSEWGRARRADPEVRKKMSDASKKAWADPEVRKKMSDARKKAWAEKNKDLSVLTPAQYRVFKTLRRKGCSREEALREAQRPVRREMAEAAE